MPTDWRWIVWLIGIFVVLRLLPKYMLVLMLLRMRFQRYSATIAESDALPMEMRAWFERAAEPILVLGFHRLGFIKCQGLNVTGAEPDVNSLFQHPDTGTVATLKLGDTTDPRAPYSIDLDTELADGRVLSTPNASSIFIFEIPPRMTITDTHFMTVEEQWHAHREELTKFGETRHPDLRDLLEANERLADEVLDQLLASGEIEATPDGSQFQLRFRAAFRAARKLATGNAEVVKFMGRRGEEIAAGRLQAQEFEPWHQARAYLRLRQSLGHPIPRFALVATLAFSAIAFGLAMSLVLGVSMALALLVVVAFHEAGHYVAMRLLGYRDTSVFFVPFLGAATVGEKQDATIAEEMTVLLAGPLPGLALGIALMIVGFESTIAEHFAVLLVGLNILNLLPVWPLDGGKALSLVLPGRQAWMHLLAGILGVAGLLALAAWARDPILIAFCALFGFGLRSQFRGMRILERVKSSVASAETEEQRAVATFGVLSDGPVQKFGQKVQLARFVESNWSAPRATWRKRVGWTIGYIVCVVGAVGACIAAIIAAP